MGRLTKLYSPEPLVLAVRVRDVCSFTTVTVVLGITPPPESATSPVMPPRVCCANTNVLDNAKATTRISNWGNREQANRDECLKGKASKIRIASAPYGDLPKPLR